MAYYALVPAAGIGQRMGQTIPKQYLPLAGHPVIWHALRALCANLTIERVFVVLAADDQAWSDQVMATLGPKLHVLRCGGETRAQSVLNGLTAMASIQGEIADDWVLVHDAARPCLTMSLLEKLMSDVGDDAVGGLLAVPVADTLKRAADPSAKSCDEVTRSVGTVARDGLWQAQTPQMFRHGLLLQALSQMNGMSGNVPTVTDEASAIEALGLAPRLVASTTHNLKITYPADLPLAEYLVSNFNDQEVA